MKRLFFTLIIFFNTIFPLVAQSNFTFTETTYYQITAPFSKEESHRFGKKMDALFNYFNEYFHFDPSQAVSKLTIKIFADREAYHTYISPYTQTNAPFLFLQFKDAKRNELVACCKEMQEFRKWLPHYAFIQFLRSFVSNPPLWIEKGFAVFFEKATYHSKQNKIFHQENLIWLPSLRTLTQKRSLEIPIDLLLKMDKTEVEAKAHSFYPLSWGIIFFLLHSTDPLYNRIIWDSIRSLQPDADLKINIGNCQKIFEWINFNRFYQEFYDYINSLKTFEELLEQGIQYYDEKNLEKAKECFDKAITLESENFISYYYLGLIHFYKKDYSMAEFYYISALKLKGETAICYYALGLNALMQDQMHKGKKYLLLALQYDSQLKEQIEKVLKQFTIT